MKKTVTIVVIVAVVLIIFFVIGPIYVIEEGQQAVVMEYICKLRMWATSKADGI